MQALIGAPLGEAASRYSNQKRWAYCPRAFRIQPSTSTSPCAARVKWGEVRCDGKLDGAGNVRSQLRSPPCAGLVPSSLGSSSREGILIRDDRYLILITSPTHDVLSGIIGNIVVLSCHRLIFIFFKMSWQDACFFPVPCKCSMAPFSWSLSSKEKFRKCCCYYRSRFFLFFKLAVLSHREEMSVIFVFGSSPKSQRFTLSPTASLCDAFPLPIKIPDELQSVKMLGSSRKCLEILYSLKYKAGK